MKKRNMLFVVMALVCGMGMQLVAEPSEALKTAMLVEDAFAEVVDKAKSSVVVIINKQYQKGPQVGMEDFPDFFGFGNPYRRQFQPQRRGSRDRLVTGSGSGVLISADGCIVTNNHVIKDFEYLIVKLEDGTIYDMQKDKDAVKIVGIDEESDLAVLQVGNGKKKDFPCLKFADSDKLRVGQWAIAIGAPFELEHSVTVGTISQKGREGMGMATFDNYIQTDASINPGNSGGPLLNIKGEIIGINQFIVSGGQSRGSIGLGFSIASNLVQQVTSDLIAHGEVKRPWLGIRMQDLTGDLKEQFNAEYGVLVNEAFEDGGAAKAGIKAGDIIQKIGGKRVNTAHELLMAVTKYKPGDKIRLDIVRGEKEKTITVLAGTRNVDGYGRVQGGASSETLNVNTLGLKLSDENGLVRVQDIIEGGVVEQFNDKNGNDQDIMVGDVILEVNRMTVSRVNDVSKALKQSRNNTAVFLIERQKRGGETYRFFIAIPMK